MSYWQYRAAMTARITSNERIDRLLNSARRALRCKTVLSSLLVIVFVILPVEVMAADVEAVGIWRSPDYTRVVIDVSNRPEYSVFVLEDPHRVVIDIRNSRMNANLRELDLDGGPVTSVRSGSRNESDTRIVLDLSAPVNPSSYSLPPNTEHGERLVVDLYDANTQAPALAPASAAPPVSESASIPQPVRVEEPARRNIVVAIDAGHGGNDPGAIAHDGHLKEKDIALAISRAVAERIKAMPGFEAVMIRDGDYYVQLQQRPQLARQNRADIFLSIHADSYSTSRAEGVTIYALSQRTAEDENIRRVTEKENSSDLLGGMSGDTSLRNFDDDLALTLLDLSMSWSIEQSMAAGSYILNAVGNVAKLRRNVPQQGNLWVLRSPDIPSLLIETGYLSNPTEARRLASADYQRKLADSIVQGVMNYFYERPPEGTFVAWQKANNQGPDRQYVVGRGDSLSLIAQRHNVSLSQLRSANSLRSDTIHIGQTLRIPGAGPSLITVAPPQVSEHTIARGETLSGIAARYSISLSRLREANHLRNDTIRVGQVLVIPAS
ncbi:LysM peptidoglycan-binding domain-containing protein [Gammaproteobacteria bacterium LSUCC0112]|nr:LysM peptidoglycan-binding domain-containing protein [Gammaproteobacteria bacterium LSUCC0112]